MVANIVKILKEVTSLNIYPVASPNAKEECIVYKYYTISDNGAKEQVRFEIRIIAKSLSKVEDLDKKIRQAFFKVGAGSKIPKATNIEIYGGGLLEDYNSNMKHKIIKFLITKKSGVIDKGNKQEIYSVGYKIID